MKNTIVYDIRAFDVHIYCKMTEYDIGTINHSYGMSFGSGNKKFCLTAMYELRNPTQIYIDRVEHDSKCVIDGSLEDFSEGTVKIVKAALWFMKRKFTKVDIFKLQDDSQIYCEKSSKLHKLSLAYDYIIKYNKTWYQSKFNAQLPGYISDGKAQTGSTMDKFNSSLHILDMPIKDYDSIKHNIHAIEDFENEYKSVNTPREFIQSLRKKYGKNYCFKVGKWLNSYMKVLHISLYVDEWFISITDILLPENYIETQLDNMTASRIFYGGKRKTRKRANYRLVADRISSEHGCVGYYKDFE